LDPSNVIAPVDSSKRAQNALTEMNVENSQESVVVEEVSAKMIQVVTIVSALVVTEWMNVETFALTSMNVVAVDKPDHAVEIAKMYQVHSDATAEEDLHPPCLEEVVKMLMNVLVVAKTHVV
jgi:hypothetical protein